MTDTKKPAPLTLTDLDELERLEREASAGPWEDCGTIDQRVSPWAEVIGLEEFGGPWHYDHSLSIKECDRALIVTARNRLPQLLALARVGLLAQEAGFKP